MILKSVGNGETGGAHTVNQEDIVFIMAIFTNAYVLVDKKNSLKTQWLHSSKAISGGVERKCNTDSMGKLCLYVIPLWGQ